MTEYEKLSLEAIQELTEAVKAVSGILWLAFCEDEDDEEPERDLHIVYFPPDNNKE